MKLNKKVLVAAVVIVATLSVAVSSLASTPQRLLDQGRELVQQAESAERNNRPVERDRLLEEASTEYGKVVKDYRRTVEAVRAKLEMGKILERKGITEKERNKNQHAAMDRFYKQIKAEYDRPVEELSRTYGADAREIRQIVLEAEARRADLAQQINERNQDHILYRILDFFVALTGRRPNLSYWLAIVMITVIVKVLSAPLTKAQFKSMREMQRIQPLVKQLQEKYKGNQKELGEKTMALYKEHGINPFASCLPLLAQFPVLYFLFIMIRLYEHEFMNGTFLWISPTLGDRFGWVASNLAQPDIPLVILYTISMFISMRLSSVDPTQAPQQKMMSIYLPILFAFLFKSFPAAFLLYWLVFNILTTVQQYFIVHAQQEPIAATATGPAAPPPATPPSSEPTSEPTEQPSRPRRRPRQRRRRR